MSGRIRSIKPEWIEDERMVLASAEARVLSVALLLLADDYGNGRASIPLLAGRVFPGKPLETLANALAELTGWFVVLYEVDGQRYFHVRTWQRHQKVDHPGKPHVPGPPEGLANSRESLAPDLRPGPTTNDREGTSAHGRAHQPPVVNSESPEQELKLAICPLNLLEKAEEAGIVRDFVERYRVEPEQIRAGVSEFVAHWTIGEGIGRKEANWMKKLRRDLKFKCETPGKLKPIGELQHAQQRQKARGNGRGSEPNALAEVMPAPYHDAWKEPDWMKS